MSMKMKHWQDPLNLIAGLWLVMSPWTLAYQASAAPTTNAVVLGILIAALALLAMYKVTAWEEWLNGALGVWLIISPWILGFSWIPAAMWNAVIVGLVVAVLAIWALGTDRDIGGWWTPAV